MKAIVFGATLAAILFSSTAWSQMGRMRVHFIDVGQGDACLVEFPCGAVLIDVGGESNDQFDSTQTLLAYLDNFFARRIDLDDALLALYLTHPHIDQTRAVRDVLDNYRPAAIITNGQTQGSGRWQQIAAHEYTFGPDGLEDTPDDLPLEWVTTTEVPSDQGLSNAIIDGVNCGTVDPSISILWGQVMSQGDWSNDDFEDENNHSLAIRIDFGQASILWTGDMEGVAVDGMLEKFSGSNALDVDVYQVGHHGSDGDTTDALMSAMTPELAVISMGPETRETSWTAWAYGHPRRSIVNLLDDNVSTTRPDTTVRVATSVRRFRNFSLSGAVYGTGWDGNIVLEATANGAWTVLQPSSMRININTASSSELVELPSIGPSKADAIIAFRDSNEPFANLDAVDAVPGIGPATLARIAPYVIVE